jgi:hypothetical protein
MALIRDRTRNCKLVGMGWTSIGALSEVWVGGRRDTVSDSYWGEHLLSTGPGPRNTLDCCFQRMFGIVGCIITFMVVYYESRKRELKRRLMNEGRCDERLKARGEEST